MNYNAVDLAEVRMLLNSPSQDMVLVNVSTVSDLKNSKLHRHYNVDDALFQGENEPKLHSSSVFQVPASKMTMMSAFRMLLDAVKAQGQIAPANVEEIEDSESGNSSLACVSKQGAKQIPTFDPDQGSASVMISTTLVSTVTSGAMLTSSVSSVVDTVSSSPRRRISCPVFGSTSVVSANSRLGRVKSNPDTLMNSARISQ